MPKLTNDLLLKMAKDLMAIESTEHNPAGLLEAYNFVVAMLRANDKDITIEAFNKNNSPSFIAYKGPKRPKNFRIILNGHLDVMPGTPDQFKPKVRGDKLYGRGATDMKAACIILADVFCEFVDKVPYPLALQITTDEECATGNGTAHHIKQGVRGDFIICGECGRTTKVYEIANEAKGVVIADIEFKGSSGHGAYPWRADNAAAMASDFVQRLHEMFPIPCQETSQTTFTVTSMHAEGGSHTKIPDHAVVKLDIRFVPGDPNFRTKRHFAALVEQIDPNASIAKIIAFSAPIYTNPTNPLLLELKAAAEKVEKHPFSFVRRHGTSDGRYYGDVGDQACEFGIAGEHQHADKEYITIAAFNNYRATMEAFLKQTIQTEKDNHSTTASWD